MEQTNGSSNTVRFIDCNLQGIIWTGTKEDMAKFDFEGGQTSEVDADFTGFNGCVWEERKVVWY